MKDFVVWLVKAIVDHPEKVSVKETAEEGLETLELSVAPEDMGRIIGKRGKIIKSIRKLLGVRGLKEEKRINLKLLEQ